MAKYVLYKENGDFKFTPVDNYNARIQDANKIATFFLRDGFETPVDVIEYIQKYNPSVSAEDIDNRCGGPLRESIERFSNLVARSGCPKVLAEAVKGAFGAIMLEASQSAEVAEQLRNKVGTNPNETHGVGVFGLSGDDNLPENVTVDNEIADGIAAGTFDSLGDDITTASPTDFNETEMGLGDSPMDDFGNDLNPDDWAAEEPAPEEGTTEEPNEETTEPADEEEPESDAGMEELNPEEI